MKKKKKENLKIDWKGTKAIRNAVAEQKSFKVYVEPVQQDIRDVLKVIEKIEKDLSQIKKKLLAVS